MKLRKDLVDELIDVARKHHMTRPRDRALQKKLVEVRWALIDECRTTFLIIHVIDLIEYLAKHTLYVKGTNKDIYKALKIFGVTVE